MGEAWVDTVNNGAWDGQEDEEDAHRDNSGAPLIPLGIVALILGIAGAPVTAVAIGATSVITTWAAYFARR